MINMICFNTNVLPDKKATATLPDGGYNFSCITHEENAEILSLLTSAASYPVEQRGIALAFCSEGTTYKPRYIVSQIIIEYTKLSGCPLDTIAEFIAYSRKSSAYRAKALEAFEKAIKNCGIDIPMYSWSRLYLTAAELYEKECQFDKALQAIEKSREYGWNKVVCVERHAEILVKTDVNQAVEYLKSNITADPQLFLLTAKLEEYRSKAAKGYKFKPRKKIVDGNDDMEQQLRRLAFRYIKKG